MQQLETAVLVIGGGATGTGVARDLAMRGVDTILVERYHLCYGTTSRHTGVLHSGCRYILRDPEAARECYQENQILRRIMPHCLEDTGGFFVVTPDDDPDYVPGWLEACHKAGMAVEEISISQMLREEPALNPRMRYCFRTIDLAGDPFLAAEANAEAARAYGARVLTYHQVTRLVEEQGRVVGALCRDLVHDRELLIRSTWVVNAAGVWAGRIAATVHLDIPLLPSKGAMVAFNQRVVNTLLCRCRVPSDADGMMPSKSVLLAGSTDGDICSPDDVSVNPRHLEIILTEAERMVPGIRSMRLLRAWAGVRPLYKGKQPTNDTRLLSRSHVLLDHEQLDGRPGIMSIIGGKWTTYRLMAQDTADLVCSKLGVQQPCRTHLEMLPAPGRRPTFYWRGARLSHTEETNSYGDLVCECELVTRQDVQRSVVQETVRTIDDLRRLRRLGMGPCQGGFCGYRAAGLLHVVRHAPVQETNAQLGDFLQGRWNGLFPVLASQQLRQARLTELIYLASLAVDRGLPATHKASDPGLSAGVQS